MSTPGHRHARVERPGFPVRITLVAIGLPLLCVIGRLPALPTAKPLNALLDLSTLPAPLLGQVHTLLTVSLGALVVVIARLVVGVRALGVLSPILLALALPRTGYLPGLAFLTVTLLLVSLGVRPMLKAHGLPYSARVAALISTVAVIMLLPLLLLRQVSEHRAAEFAYFPIVALALITERFAATAHREGERTAIGRTAITMAEASTITFIGTTLGGITLLTHHPELLLVQIWFVIFLSRYLGVRVIERWRTAAQARAAHRPEDLRAAPNPSLSQSGERSHE